MEEALSRLPSHHPNPEAFMRYFQPPADTRFYAGVDLHARSLFLSILDRDGQGRFARNLPAAPEPFLKAVQPFRDGLVVGCECMHCWYWLADACRDHDIAFALGHAWAMKAVHGSKTKCDRHDAEAIARLLRGGNFPLAYAYPKERRGLRDLLRARLRLVRQRAELYGHVHTARRQANLPPVSSAVKYRSKRCGAAAGNAWLKWAFSEAAVLSAQKDERIGGLLQRLASKMGKAKAYSALAHKLGRAFYHMLHTKEVFDVQRVVRR
jgi:hypothetical protein